MAPIKEERFEDAIIALQGKTLSENLYTSSVLWIFVDLLHEVDHTLTPQGHSPEFAASSRQFISTSEMTRVEALDHYFEGRDFTYSVERAHTQTLRNIWFLSRIYSEGRCMASCTDGFEEYLNNYMLDEIIWFEISPDNVTGIANDLCLSRKIPRDANEAGLCNRHPAIAAGLDSLGTCHCAEFRKSDLRKSVNLLLINKGISDLDSHDFLYFDNLEYLNLSDNLISEIPNDLFMYLPNLKRLLIHRTPISILNVNSFYGITNLEKLEIKWSGLTGLSLGQFAQLPNLLELDLKYSQLTEIRLIHFTD